MSADEDVFEELFGVVETRRDEQPAESYTAALLADDGVDPVLEKLGEETTEVIVAAKNDDTDRVVEESADLVYHLFVLLAARDVTLDDLRAALRERRG